MGEKNSVLCLCGQDACELMVLQVSVILTKKNGISIFSRFNLTTNKHYFAECVFVLVQACHG